MTIIIPSKREIEECRGRTLLKAYLEKNFSQSYIEKFDELTTLYYQVNSVINISALKNPDDIYIKHYLDSIVAHEYFSGDCCDVGCGGGFPCIPLAIVTQLNVLGIDGIGKKLTLINKTVDSLGLTNIKSRHTRAEDLSKSGERFDTVCARAVADSDKVLSYCAPLAKIGGKIILYKTQSDDKASAATLKKQNCELSLINDYILPGTDIKRRIFIYSRR